MDSFQDIFDKIDYKKNKNVKETNKTDKILTALYKSISKINSRVKNISEIFGFPWGMFWGAALVPSDSPSNSMHFFAFFPMRSR